MIYIDNQSEQYQDVYVPRTSIVTGGTYNPFDPSNYWTSAETEAAIESATSGLAESSAVTAEIEDAVSGLASETYVDNAVSGLATEQYVDDAVSAATSGVTEQIEQAVSGKADSSAVTEEIQTAVSGLASETYVDNAVSGLATEQYVDNSVSGLASETYVDNSVSGKADSSAVTQQIQNAVSGLASEQYVDTAVSGKQDTLSAGTNISIDSSNTISVTGITVPTKVSDLQNDSGFVDSGDVETQISAATSGLASESYVNTAVSGKQDTLVSSGAGQNIKTINNESLLGSGNITISGGSGAIEMTQADYNALSGNVSADTFYVITDATPIDMTDYATTGALNSVQTALTQDINGKADKNNVTANSSYLYFPTWNNQGVITGNGTRAYASTVYVSGGGYTFYRNSSGSITIVSPSGNGTSGQVLTSNGTSTPIWATQIKPVEITSAAYEALVQAGTTDPLTLYLINDE